MKKKVWTSPEALQLNVSQTKEGSNPTGTPDATTYDAGGNWWISGVKADS